MVEVVFENFVNYLRSGNTDKLNIISFQQNQQHKINLSTQLIFYRILTKTVVQLSKDVMDLIFDDDCYDGENLVNGSIPKYQQLLQFWSDIDNSIEEETFMKEKLWQPIEGMHTQNRLQPDKISKIENNNMVKDVFSEDSLDEV
ncbi:Hypothetical_protein [Hexamita inflata]|uniref:Hypothetical_protein n=1 Tax=Hexamita inflata TaxID=28002 RepID=A0AA86P3D2_9EUKA|nr:Hypothetical protein HINF_LOCUS17785 [Hexamita inflata]